MSDDTWMAQAACAHTGPGLFFPEGNPWTEAYRADAAAAATICQGCPVRWQCRTAANRRPERHGIWGGHDYGAHWNATGQHRRRRPLVAIIHPTDADGGLEAAR